jgi:putative ABC transport system ATP-binding protein
MMPKSGGEDATIVLESVSKEYKMGETKVHALSNIDLVVKRGERIAMIGPSGSGKSTLLNIMGLLDRPTSGRVLFNGRSVEGMGVDEASAIRRDHIGFVFQQFHLIPWLSALENVEVPMAIAELPGQSRRVRARKLLESVGLGGRLRHKPSEMSGGEQQRVAIARALANNPSIIMADEPTGNVDSRTGIEIAELLKNVCEAGEVTLVFVTHNFDLVNVLAQREILLRDGIIAKEVRV